MDILDAYNLFAYILFVINVARAEEWYVYLYNRIVIALRDV